MTLKQDETISVGKGIWIDERRLADAGLGDEVTITVRPGEIRIIGAATQPSDRGQDAWDHFRSLGREAQPGVLVDPSTNHDQYLYGQTK
jgi:hypothetical protein